MVPNIPRRKNGPTEKCISNIDLLIYLGHAAYLGKTTYLGHAAYLENAAYLGISN